MSKIISISSKLDQATLTNGVKQVLNENVLMRYASILGVLLILASAVLFVYVFKLTTYAPIIGVIGGIFFIFFKPLMAHLSVNKLGPEDRAYEQINYKFHQAYFEVIGETFKSKMPWEHFLKVKETEKFVLFFQNALAANIIPKDDFTQEQFNQFLAMMNKNKNVKFFALENLNA